jgi:serine/threonine-protein phosphatase PGAM5
MARTRLYLVRHGEQAHGEPAHGQREPGQEREHASLGLSPLGRDQADRLGRRLRSVPFANIHYSPLPRAAETAEIVADRLARIPRHACDHVADRTPVPSPGRRDEYPRRWHRWLDGVPAAERDEDAAALRVAVEHFGVTGPEDRHELLITHNFVIGWFVRHVLDAPEWRWIGLNHDNCGITVLQWELGRPPVLVSYNDTGHLHT